MRPSAGLLGLVLAVVVAAPAAAAAAPLRYDAPRGGSALTLQRAGSDLRLVDDATGAVVAARALADTTAVDVRGTDAGDDTLTVDLGGGAFLTVPVAFDGGAGGFDTLAVTRAGRAATESNQATGPQSGTLALDDLRIAYANVEPITDTVPVINFTFNAAAAATRVGLDNAPTPGQLTISDLGTSTFESDTFANKTNVTINAGTSEIGVNLDNTVNATGMASLAVNGSPLDDTFAASPRPPRPPRSTAPTGTTPTCCRGAARRRRPRSTAPRAGSDRYFATFGALSSPGVVNDTGVVGVDELPGRAVRRRHDDHAGLGVARGPERELCRHRGSAAVPAGHDRSDRAGRRHRRDGRQRAAGRAGPRRAAGRAGPARLPSRRRPRRAQAQGQARQGGHLAVREHRCRDGHPGRATRGRKQGGRGDPAGGRRHQRDPLERQGRPARETYTLALTLSSADGQTATARGKAVIGR